MSSGLSARESVKRYIATHPTPFSLRLLQSLNNQPCAWHSDYQRAFWELISRGLEGQPIVEPLTALEAEIETAANHELDQHLATLPFKALIPLLGLQFPAFALLLLGPLMRELAKGLGA
jgi:hypothetical protein